MASLPDTLRRQLEKAVITARDIAEVGARAALERLAVRRPEPFAEMSAEERVLRVLLRAHSSQLGDPRKESGEQETLHLVAECAYEHWHRMLFARFLAENRLLIHPEHGVPVTLAECEELAAEAGEDDGWALAGRFAARMLPAIFRPDDPVLRLRFAPEHQQALEKCLSELAAEVFTADDSLGWVYQFWQTKRKKQVNESGRKIGADELPAVTQLFTEPYMVQFLLHNTLGAWWAGKVLARQPELAQTAESEEALRQACALSGCAWTYHRFIREEEGGPWRSAAGTLEGWPERAAAITMLDPCCGSGHFLVEAFRILVPMRMAEEGLSAREACEAVLRDNLFGLEIDERCTQIAAFNLALAAWTYPKAEGYRPLPELHIACSGLSVGAKEEEWLKLAGKDERLREGMRRLYHLFNDAPTLGSLIDPRREEAELFKAGFEELQPLLEQALAREDVKRDAQATEAGIAAQGMARAAALLAESYTLVATNVPYLSNRKQSEKLKHFCTTRFPRSKQDLGATFLERLLCLLSQGGVMALVTSQYWLFKSSYATMRRNLLEQESWLGVVRLGTGAFREISGEVVNAALVMIEATAPAADAPLFGLDLAEHRAHRAREKAEALRSSLLLPVRQQRQLQNPGARIIFADPRSDAPRLKDIAEAPQGIKTGDDDRWRRFITELPALSSGWERYQTTVSETVLYGGRTLLIDWRRGGEGMIRPRKDCIALGRTGVAISQSGGLHATLYTGERFDSNVAPIIPRQDSNLVAPLWTFCSSTEYHEKVREIDRSMKVTNVPLIEVEFEAQRWKAVAKSAYQAGLPKPYSDDPTQWLFHGHPLPCAFGPAVEPPWPAPETLLTKQRLSAEGATTALQVAAARLLGYRWPAEVCSDAELSDEAQAWISKVEALLELAAADGLVCIPPVRGEQPAADRLQRLLSRAFGKAWTPGTLSALLDQVGFLNNTLEDWLRDGFFEQHCQLFHQRPFVWHIWDGRRDGFAALVNYHKLDRKLLERLTYAVLGDWIARQRQGVKAGERGAEDRLAAADAFQKRLALILEGEPPYDIFVRWKPVEQQPIGWEPDLNDGVRMNIRPFVEAGVLRKNQRMNWNKDRGAEPESLRPARQFPWFWKDSQFTGERVNDVHLTNAEKRAARERARANRQEASR